MSISKTFLRDSAIGVRATTETRRFYVWMAGACVAIAGVGFAPTYWLQLAPKTFTGSPLLHLHAVLFTAWPLYLLMQATFVIQKRVGHHRAWGLLGLSLATAMVFVGFAVANAALERKLAAGGGDQVRAFHIASTSMITLFAVFVFLAIIYVGRPEVHKRLMLLATIAILPPAVARVFFAATVGMAPGLRPGLGPSRTVESVLTSALIADALVLAGMLYDTRTRRRPHPVYVIGGTVILAVQVLRGPASTTRWWYAVADVLARFSG